MIENNTKVIPNEGCIMSIKEFKDDCKQGFITSYDGYGYYTDGETIYKEYGVVRLNRIKSPKPSVIKKVIWYNR